MDNFDIKGDEVRHGKQLYLDAPTQASVDSFDDKMLSEKMLYQLNNGMVAIQPTSAKKIAEASKNSDGLGFALRLKQDNACIGFANLGDIGWQARIATLHITILDEASFTLDIVQDAIQTLLQFAYWEANLNRIEVNCLEDNAVLREALEKTGFSQEGQHRQEAYRNGRYLDILIYGILAREWSA